jgi:hypothetical protein
MDPGSRAGAGWTLRTGRRTPPAGCLGTPANVPRYINQRCGYGATWIRFNFAASEPGPILE